MSAETAIQVQEHHGTRSELRALFELAEDSASELVWLDRALDD
jgi:hypothetical protein